MNKKLSLWLVTGLAALCSYADVTLDPVFSSHMMLQQAKPIAFFGVATPEANVTVEFNGQTNVVAAGKDGAWRAEFPAMKASYTPYTMKATEGNTIELTDLLVGDVWVCAGQSNMEMPIGKKFKRGWSALNCEQEVAEATYPAIRLGEQCHNMSLVEPVKEAKLNFKACDSEEGEFTEEQRNASADSWVVCSPKVADRFSATAYFFARHLHKELDIPIGLIKTTWSGTRIEPWIPKDAYKAAGLKRDLAAIRELEEKFQRQQEIEQGVEERYQKALAEWQKKVDAVEDPEAKKKIRKPNKERLPWRNPQEYCILYNGMVNPWTKLPVKGVIWYQGCSNAGNGYYYHLQKALIAGWRAKWNNPTMPFLIVQLASFNGPEDWATAAPEKNNLNYALTRETQAQVAREDPNVGLACALDIGENKNIHPANKQEVGRRLALEAERIAYGKNIVSRGPTFAKATVNADKKEIEISYDNVAGGLKTSDGNAPNGFLIAGADKKFVWADARIEGDKVIVSSPSVGKPKYVRYGYVGYRGDYNLQNSLGLAAYPFRSDSISYQVRVNPLFSSHMVLQQGYPIAFWGTGLPLTKMDIRFNGELKELKTDDNGDWRVEFPALKAGYKQYVMSAGNGGSEVRLVDLLVGDVWLCSGQSNMELPVGWDYKRGSTASNSAEEVENADYPGIRVTEQSRHVSVAEENQKATSAFQVRDNVEVKLSNEELGGLVEARRWEFFQRSWSVCSPRVAGRYSAAGYFFARQLHKDLDIPIGLIKAAWNGTQIQPWISRDGYFMMNMESDMAHILDLEEQASNKALAEQKMEEEYQQRYAKWQKDVEECQDPLRKAKLSKQPPVRFRIPWNNCQEHCALYNGMVHPWTQLPIKGVIWYQGCSNAGQPRYYLMQKALIAGWRKAWNNPTMPFLIVQLAGHGSVENLTDVPEDKNNPRYALTREVQAQVAREDSNVGLACALDIGERDNIHPGNKQEVGRRLALEAERIAYGKDIVSRGPAFDAAVVEGNAIRVSYKNADRGLKTSDGKAPIGFSVAGDDLKFVWAEARIDGNTVVVSSPAVPAPKYVHYGYFGYCGNLNLQNTEGLPAYPFRSNPMDFASIK